LVRLAICLATCVATCLAIRPALSLVAIMSVRINQCTSSIRIS
jgi:hypothetical protein